jgi:5-methylthioadenosine/S-adenosylhomocysteine deaminase
VHTKRQEIEVLKRHSVSIAHMPLSNCEVGGGIAPLKELLEAGLSVSLGTDGYVTDMFEVMRAAFLIHKGYLQDASIIPASTVIEMATISGAKALGMEDQIGSLQVGKQGDVVLLDPSFPTPLTPENAYSQMVAFGTGNDVDTVIVSGKVIASRGRMRTIDEQEAKKDCSNVAKRFWNNA